MRPIVAAAILGLLLSESALSQEAVPQRQPSEQQNKGASESQKDAQSPQVAPPPDSTSVLIPQAADRSHDAPADHNKNQNQQFDWLKFFYEIKVTDVLLVLFTALLALFTGRLWYATAGLWEAAKEQAGDLKRSVAAASDAATAAAKQASIAERAFTELERPYVFVSQCSLVDWAEHHPSPHLEISLTNYGRTPALMHQIIIGARLKEEQSDEIADEIMQPIANVIGPTKSFEGVIWGPGFFDAATFRRILNGLNIFRVQCRLSYEDIFGNDLHSRIHYIWDPKSSVFIRDEDDDRCRQQEPR